MTANEPGVEFGGGRGGYALTASPKVVERVACLS